MTLRNCTDMSMAYYRFFPVVALLFCLFAIFLALHVLPGASPAAIGIGGTIIIGSGWAVLRRARMGVAAEVLFMVVATALIIGVIANVNYYTTAFGCSDAQPYLQNADANRVWNNALAFYNGTWHDDAFVWNFFGAVISLTFLPGGPSITAALMVSVACGAATMVLTSLIAKCLTDSAKVAVVAMLAVASVCYLMASATILVKDIWVAMCFAAAGYGLCEWRRSSFVWVLMAILLLGLARKNMILALLLGVIITVFPINKKELKSQFVSRIALIIIGIAIIVIAQHLTISPTIAGQLTGTPEYTESHQGARHAFYSIIGEETNTDILRKLLLFPVLALTQFLIPLPWDFARDTIFGPTLAYAHFGYPWYLFGIIFVYYMCTAKRVAGTNKLLVMSVWALIVWLIPVYTAMGTVSRYALCAVPLMAPAVAAVVMQCRQRRSFWCWLAFCVVAIGLGLLMIHHLQYSVTQ